MNKALSIIIPVYKDLNGLKSTISDLRTSNIPVEFEIIVCNDGYDRLISDWLANQGIKEIKVIERKGSYYARNRGIEIAKANWLLFVDAGVAIKPNWFDLVGDKWKDFNYLAFNINLSISKEMGIMKRYSEFYEFRCKDYWKQNHFGPTAFLLVNKQVFNETGKFNENLLSGGDFELGNRCWHANVKMSFIDNNLIFHEPRSLYKKYKKQIRVLQGIKQLKHLYPNRAMKLPDISWTEFFKAPIKFLYTLKRINHLPSKSVGNWGIIPTVWAEFWHQKMYYWALLKVLTTNKARFD